MIKCPNCDSKVRNSMTVQADGENIKVNVCVKCGLNFFKRKTDVPTDLIPQKLAAHMLGLPIQGIHQRIITGSLMGYKLDGKGYLMVSRYEVEQILARRQAKAVADRVTDGGRNDPAENFGG